MDPIEGEFTCRKCPTPLSILRIIVSKKGTALFEVLCLKKHEGKRRFDMQRQNEWMATVIKHLYSCHRCGANLIDVRQKPEGEFTILLLSCPTHGKQKKVVSTSFWYAMDVLRKQLAAKPAYPAGYPPTYPAQYPPMPFPTSVPPPPVKILKELEQLIGKSFPSVANIYWNTFGVKFEGGTIVGLGLYRCGLRNLPDPILQMKSLIYLTLGANQLTTLPESFGDLKSLQVLNLNENLLATLPEPILQLKFLKELNLTGNQLTTLPESFSNLLSLQELNLSGNQLTTLPEPIFKLKSLQVLGLGWNQLPVLSESIGQLKSLRSLFLRDNQLMTLPESFGELKSLQILDLSSNQLTALPGSFSQLSNLQRLNLGGNPIWDWARTKWGGDDHGWLKDVQGAVAYCEPRLVEVKATTPEVKPVIQATTPKVKPFIQATTPKVKPFIQATTPKVKPVIQATTPEVKPVIQATTPEVKPVIQATTPEVNPVIERPFNESEQEILNNALDACHIGFFSFCGMFTSAVTIMFVAITLLGGFSMDPIVFMVICIVMGILSMIIPNIINPKPLVNAIANGTAYEVRAVPSIKRAFVPSVTFGGITFIMAKSQVAKLTPDRINKITFAHGGSPTKKRKYFSIGLILAWNDILVEKPELLMVKSHE